MHRWILNRALSLLLVGIVLAAVPADDSDALRQKQQAQEKARALATELVSAVLDVQLRQLDENGLQSLPIYRDIVSMKANIDHLVRTDMDAVVQLLAAAQAEPPEHRLPNLNAARAKIRDVVVQLMAERQKLNRRMRVARVAAESKQLIALQTRTHETTQSLPDRRPDDRERLALLNIEDQADVTKLYYQLVASLADVATWGGPAAAGASDGLRILKAAQVEPELKSASASLAKADFPAAASNQRSVLKGLLALLEKLEETQGLIDSDREAALRLVRELLAKQQALRNQTRQTDLTERTAEPLIDQQARLQKELSKLASLLAKYPTTESFIEQAKAASFEATARLFEEKKSPTIDEQGRVIGNLVQIEKVLADGLDLGLADKSADELAAEVAALTELQKQLTAASQTQSQAVAAKILQAAAELGDFPNFIRSRLDDALEQVNEAPQAAAAKAQTAIHQAQAEVQAHLADTIRRQKAVEVGELARAAEALERASAAEREIAHQTGAAAKGDDFDSTKSARLAAEHFDVSEVAARIAAGVKNTSPETSQSLTQAASLLAEITENLDRPAQDKISSSAKAAAQQLADAAAQLRKQQGLSAEALTKIAAQQLAAAETARQAVEKANEAAKNAPTEAIFLLQQARKKIAEAQTEHAKAEGRAAEAEANQLVEQVAALAQQQNDAEAAALELSRGLANTPLEAASLQQEVADNVSDLAKQSPTEIAQPLKSAAKSAAKAARETLNGSPSRAESARKQASAAIAEATAAAQQLAKRAAESPSGQLDAAAQKRVADKAGQAQEFATEAATSSEPIRAAITALKQAKQDSAAAAQQITASQLAAASATQATTRKLLTQASEHIAASLRDLAARDFALLNDQVQLAQQLAKQSALIDAGAAAALAQVQKTVSRQEVQHKLDQALASLAAREQQLGRHRDLAETLAALAADQASAREAIAQAASQLEQPPHAADSTAQQLAAAQSLAQAEHQFAATQTSTGESAAEVSGQEEVANQPIREALEIASRLNQLTPPPTDGQPANENEQPQKADGKNQPASENQQSQKTANSNQQPPAEGQADVNQKSKSSNQKSPSDLGTKMVPASPQITAKQISGPQAKNAAASAMAAAMKGKAKGQPGQEQGESDSQQEGESSTAKKGGTPKADQTAKNEKAKAGDLETGEPEKVDSRGELANQDAAAILGDMLQNEAWFARLPPSLRSAIQAKSRGKAPRGYEERLRRYFESLD